MTKEQLLNKFWHRTDHLRISGELRISWLWRGFFRKELSAVTDILDHIHTLALAAGDLVATTIDDLEEQLRQAMHHAREQGHWDIDFEQFLKAVGSTYVQYSVVGRDFTWPGFPQATQDWLNSYIPKLVDQIQETSLKDILTVIRNGVEQGITMSEVKNQVEEAYQGFQRSRPDLIARTETGRVMTRTQQDVIAELPVDPSILTQMWITARDNRVRDSHIRLEGCTAKIGATFINKDGIDTGLHYPLDPEGAPEEVINCRCALIVVTPEIKAVLGIAA